MDWERRPRCQRLQGLLLETSFYRIHVLNTGRRREVAPPFDKFCLLGDVIARRTTTALVKRNHINDLTFLVGFSEPQHLGAD